MTAQRIRAASATRKFLIVGLFSSAFVMGGCGGGVPGETTGTTSEIPAAQPQEPSGPTIPGNGETTGPDSSVAPDTGAIDPDPDPTQTVGTIRLSWSAPSERESGKSLALTDLSGYRIYYGPVSNPTENQIDVADPTASTYELDSVAPGTYQVAISAFDSNGLESSRSNSKTKSID